MKQALLRKVKEFLEGPFSPSVVEMDIPEEKNTEKRVQKGTIALDRRAGWVYIPGEKLPEDDDVAIFQKGTPIEIIVLEGQIRPNMGERRVLFYSVACRYSLADFFFQTPFLEWRRYLEFDDRKGRYRLDLLGIRDRAERELAKIIIRDLGPFQTFLFGSPSNDFFEWCGVPEITFRWGSVAEQFSKEY